MVQGTRLNPSLSRRHFSNPHSSHWPSSSFSQEPSGNGNALPRNTRRTSENKCASEWLADFRGFVLNFVLLAKSHSPNAKDQQGWQNLNRSLINPAYFIVLCYISSDNSQMQGWLWGAVVKLDCFKKQISPSPEISVCMAQTGLRSFPSSHNRCPCNTFAFAGYSLKQLKEKSMWLGF